MKPHATGDDVLVQLAARIPRRIARDAKQFCIRNDLRLQVFIRAALAEKLAAARQRRRA